MPRKTPSTRKTASADEGAPLQDALRRPRICFERIIPDAIDPEQHVRRALRSEMMAAAGGQRTLKAGDVGRLVRMSLVTSKKWSPGATVRCRFLDGTPKMQKKVKTHCKGWEKFADVKIKFVTKDPAEVRISFYADDGSWSAVGRDCLNASYYPVHQPTMNFGWVRDDSDATEDRAVILHEFGHALGCVHEHQAPTFDRKWNVEAVMKYFKGPPNYWDAEAIRENVLMKYSPRGLQSTQYDPKSIMLYAFDGELFSDGKGPTNENTDLSPTDRSMIKRMYP